MVHSPEHEEQDDPPLWRALALAFGEPQSARADGLAPSILDQLENQAGGRPQVVLRRAESDQDRSSTPGEAPRARTKGRYRVDREIGRGGVGRVLAGRDLDLGRVVAMKVLHDHHRQSPQLVRRFVEEAQIGGQLQHPGIVPVYELGLDDEEQPFFTMKLVQGRTLAELLADRASPEEDRHRFLGIFSQVCQTIAYAHTRGVVHRDLKPANIMVGSFGEVQVVDWGLAKVLGQPESVPGAPGEHRTGAETEAPLQTVRSRSEAALSEAGTVMGTPAYMPPEQAQGRGASADERSDVFALGAILCEILTASPPYSGPRDLALEKARQTSLGEARSRLHEAQADPSLLDLTLRCLAPQPNDRPRHAGILAEEIEHHLASVQARARTAELEAAQARVKAAHEQRARRLTLALGGTLLAVLVLVSFGTVWFNREQTRRAAEVSNKVGRALEEARLTSAQALGKMQELEGSWPGSDAEFDWPLHQAHGRTALEHWSRAIEAAGSAEILLPDPDTRPALSAEVARTLISLREQQTLAQARFDEAQRDHSMYERINELIAQWGTRSWHEVDQDFEEAFADYGLDIALLSTEEAVAFLQTRRMCLFLSMGVFAWVRTFSLSLREDPPRTNEEGLQAIGQVQKMLRIVRGADPDPVRMRIREALGLLEGPAQMGLRFDRLRDIAAEPEREEWPENTILFLAYLLSEAGPEDRLLAIDLLVQARSRFPRNAVIPLAAGEWLLRLPDPDWEEAKGLLLAATALEPTLLHAWMLLAECHRELGELQRAERAYRRALTCPPADHPAALLGLARLLLETGRYEEAQDHASRALDDPLHATEAEAVRGEISAWAGDEQGSARSFARALTLSEGAAAIRLRRVAALRVQRLFPAAREELQALEESRPELLFEDWMLRGRLELESGEVAAAYHAFRQAQKQRPDDQAASTSKEEARLLLTLEEYLPNAASASLPELTVGEKAALAELCLVREWPVAASLLYRSLAAALPQTPSLLGPHSFLAAQAALRAALGEGRDAADLPHAQRVELAHAAITWIERILAERPASAPDSDRAHRTRLRTLLRTLELSDLPPAVEILWEPLRPRLRAVLAP